MLEWRMLESFFLALLLWELPLYYAEQIATRSSIQANQEDADTKQQISPVTFLRELPDIPASHNHGRSLTTKKKPKTKKKSKPKGKGNTNYKRSGTKKKQGNKNTDSKTKKSNNRNNRKTEQGSRKASSETKTSSSSLKGPGNWGIQEGSLSGMRALPLPNTLDQNYLHKAPWNFNRISSNIEIRRYGEWLVYKFPANPGSCYPSVSGVSGGISAAANPFGMFPSNSIKMQVKVHFPPDFIFGPVGKPTNCAGYFTRGGKLLLGAKIGNNYAGGGIWSNDSGLVRLMYMSDPGELPADKARLVAYVYLPISVVGKTCAYRDYGPISQSCKADWMDDQFLEITQKTGTGGYTLYRKIPIGKSLMLSAGKTYNIGLRVKLNSPGKADGVLSIHVNQKKLEHNGILFTRSGAKITGLSMDSWMGGGTNDWVPLRPVHYLAQNFRAGA